VSSDRLSTGDLLTIEGKNFIPSGELPQTFVIFEDLPPILVTPDSNTQISITVPQGTKSGTVKVKTTSVVDGTLYELESNEIKILVIWKEYDLRPISEYLTACFGNPPYPFYPLSEIIGGLNDDLFLFFIGGGYTYSDYVLVHIQSDGGWGWQYVRTVFYPGYPLWDLKVDPITGSPAYLLLTNSGCR